ncbi:MAG: winged helix-turn-helix transcriptional regulator [Candidatus Thorarchaeota archaeon]
MAAIMDILDKSIIMELMTNSRVSCQELAEKYNSSRGVVRKRINKLVEKKIIQHYSAWYHLAMVDAEFVFGHVKIGLEMGRETLVRELVQHPMIHVVIPVVTGDIVFHAIAVGTEGLSSLGSSIRKLDNVEKVELHLVQADRGNKVELKKIHLQVLSALFENSRISVAEIARRTGLSSRRVKRALDEIEEGHGISLAIVRNPALGSGLSFYAKISWEERKSDVKILLERIEREFPAETWESYISASAPVIFVRFFVDHIRDVETISNALVEYEEIEKLETLVFYPARISSVLTRDKLREDIIEAGFDVSYH